MIRTLGPSLALFLGFTAAVTLSATQANAQEQPAAEAPAKPKAKKPRAASASLATLEARHKVCLDFIRRHGESCDPWETPTCGYDVGYARPLECVKP